MKTRSTAKATRNQALATRMESVDEDRYFSRAVGKAFELIELLNKAGGPMSLTELANKVGLTKTSAYRLLFTLVSLRHAKQDGNGHYLLAAENWISPSVQIANALRSIAREPAQALRTRFQETVSLAVLYSNHIEVILGFESPRIIRMANTLGGIIPPHASSLGKAITAFQAEAVCSKLIHSYGIRKFTEHTITDEEALVEELGEVRRRHYAFEDEEAFLDGCCLGCPIFAGSDTAVAAISISMPKFRLPAKKERDKMVAELQKAAEEISERLRLCLLTTTER
jgi:IclR family acetate operon transcriptional repressor